MAYNGWCNNGKKHIRIIEVYQF